jgi:glycosyltransferase involved in cell wall biosynthesis
MKLSVLMAVYPGDDPRLLGEALDSLARQTTPAAEIVLVEDGPLTPALAAVIDAYRGRLPVVSLRRPRTEGLGAALADGLAACRF